MIENRATSPDYASLAASRRPQVGVAVLDRVAVWNVLLMLAIAACIGGYLVMNNRAAEKAFSIRAEELRIADLKDKKQALDLSIVTAQSMGAIDANVQTLGLVPVTDVEYVNVGSSVAVK